MASIAEKQKERILGFLRERKFNHKEIAQHGIVTDRDGRYAYVTNTYANSVSVLDITNRTVTKTVPVGKAPNGISIRP